MSDFAIPLVGMLFIATAALLTGLEARRDNGVCLKEKKHHLSLGEDIAWYSDMEKLLFFSKEKMSVSTSQKDSVEFEGSSFSIF